MKRYAPLALTGYAAAIVAANYLTAHHGLIPVGFGLTATAGTYCAGAALMLRNLVQDGLGRRFVVLAIATGAALSALTSPALALASGVAFGVSELVDTALYTPLRRRGWARAVLPASLLGAILDSLLFLAIAGFPVTVPGVAGQLVGKTWAVWLPVAAVTLARGVRRGAVHGNAVESSGA
ncbi:MAG TPA: VUT family protein [Burkholderiaceae bacterium]